MIKIKNKYKFLILIIVVLTTSIMYIKFGKKDLKNDVSIENAKIKSGNLSVDYTLEQTLEDIEKLGLNTINIPIQVDIENLKSDKFSINQESKNKAINLMKKLKRKNINIILEAYPWINNGEDYETEWQPNNIDIFFENWKNILNEVVNDLGKPFDVFAINVASNFVFIEKYEDKWCDVVDYVRKEFDGFITYRTSWWYTAKWDLSTYEKYNEKINNLVFGKVDFISVSAYFELSDKNINTKDEIVEDLFNTKIHNREQDVKKELYEFHKKWNKPIFFGELGFPRLDGALKEPWNVLISNTPNNIEQSIGFESYKEVFENEDWNMGFSIFAIGNRESDKLYYPSSESVKIIKSWYEE